MTVNYATSSGGGCNNLNQATSGTLTFTPGETTQVVRVIINDCGTTTTEGEGWTYFTLSGATVGVIVRPRTLIGVVGDPSPLVATPGLDVRNAVVDNTAGTVSVPVLLGGPTGATSASTVTVHYTTANGSAVAGTDYTTSSGTLTYAPGQTVQNISAVSYTHLDVYKRQGQDHSVPHAALHMGSQRGRDRHPRPLSRSERHVYGAHLH